VIAGARRPAISTASSAVFPKVATASVPMESLSQSSRGARFRKLRDAQRRAFHPVGTLYCETGLMDDVTPNASPELAAESAGMVSRLASLPIQASVRLGRQRMTVSELSRLTPGAILELDSHPGLLQELVVNGLTIGSGPIVRQGTHLGIRLDLIRGSTDRSQSPGSR